MHVSAIVDILPGYRGTYIRGYALSGIAVDSKFSIKNEGYLFSEGYLFTGFYGICLLLIAIIADTANFNTSFPQPFLHGSTEDNTRRLFSLSVMFLESIVNTHTVSGLH